MNPLRPTRAGLLLSAAALAAAIGWGLVQVVDAWLGRLLPVPWLAAASVWLLAGATLSWALSSRPRLQRRPGAKPMPPIVAARTAALAMAGSRAGSLVAGLYAGIAVATVPAFATPSGSATFWSATLASVGAVALVAAALWLEHLCRLPTGPEDAYRDRV